MEGILLLTFFRTMFKIPITIYERFTHPSFPKNDRQGIFDELLIQINCFATCYHEFDDTMFT